MSYIIAADSAANLTNTFIKENNITVIPLSFIIDDKENIGIFDETDNYSDFYNALRSGVRATTSQINPEKFCEYFEPHLKNKQDILYIGISSGVSGCINSANIAAAELKDKYPDRKILIVDSLGASSGIFPLIFSAVRNKHNGIDIETTFSQLNKLRHKIMQIFTVGDLMHLRRSGRVSTATAVIGTALGIKPILKGDKNGKIVVTDKVRGRKKVLSFLIQAYKELSVKNDLPVCISHCDCPEDAKTLARLINEITPDKQVLSVVHEPVTGIHIGPDSLALYFVGDDGVREK